MNEIESLFQILHPSTVAEQDAESLGNAKEIFYGKLGSEETDLDNSARRSD